MNISNSVHRSNTVMQLRNINYNIVMIISDKETKETMSLVLG